MIIPLEGIGDKEGAITKLVVSIIVDKDKVLILKNEGIININSRFVYEPIMETLKLLISTGGDRRLLISLMKEEANTNGISRHDIIEYLQTVITEEAPFKGSDGMSRYLDVNKKIKFLRAIIGSISFL